ncbi:hypothetical protein [Spirulina major]|nr:hypothetical protein [Spirulina major]
MWRDRDDPFSTEHEVIHRHHQGSAIALILSPLLLKRLLDI